MRPIRETSQTLLRAPVSTHDLFSGLGFEARERLSRIKHKTFFHAHELLFPLRRRRRGVFILNEGRAQLVGGAGTYLRSFVRLAKPHEILGLSEAIEDLPYFVNVETISPCVFEYIRRVDFLRFLTDEPDVCFRLLQLLSSNVQTRAETFLRR